MNIGTSQEQIQRILVKLGESTLGKGEKEMNDLMPKESADIANAFRGDMLIRQRAFEKVLMNKYMKYYESILDSGELDDMLPIMKKIHEKEEKEDECRKSDYCFITICPQELRMNPLELIKYAEKVVKFVYIKKYCYVIEQRFSGIPDDRNKQLGDGIHLHMLVNKGEYKFSHLKRDINRVFKNVNSNIDIKNIREGDIQKVQGYMTGVKKEEFKQVKQEQDRIWREKQHLREFYGEMF